MKKIAWLLVAALLFSVMPVSTGMGDVQAEGVELSIEPTVTASSKYYEVKDVDGVSHYPLVLSIGELDQNCNYTVTSITVDGVDYKDKFEMEVGTGDNAVTVYADAGKFLSVSEMHHIEVVITDEHEETFTAEKDFVLEPMQDSYVLDVKEPQYFSCAGVRQTGIKIDHRQFMTKNSSATINKVELVNQTGQVFGSIQQYNIHSYPAYNLADFRYTDEKVQRKCSVALEKMIGSPSRICQISFNSSSKLDISAWEDIKPGFYNLVFTLSDGTIYTYKNAYEAVTRPVVYSVMDSSYVDNLENGAVMTDQTGDYVSIYVYGWNINKDTVKPVFYNESGSVISGDVAAVETGKWGAFFRIEKEQIDEDEKGWGSFYSLRPSDGESEDWNIPLSTYSWDALNRAGDKTFTIKLEMEDETIEEEVDITRREIFYQYYDQRDKTYTVYFAQKADVDTTFKPTLFFQKYDYNIGDYSSFVTVENGTFTEQVNALTGQKEIKAVFNLTDGQIAKIQENSYDSYYAVAYKTADGEEVNFRSSYIYTRTVGDCDVEDVPTRGRLNGYNDTIFYLPYWIGGVHTIVANGQNSYYLTKSDGQTLGVGKYAYAEIFDDDTMQNSNFTKRSWQYYFWEEGTPLTPPVGTPELTVVKEGESWRFSWNDIAGATGYRFQMKYGGASTSLWHMSETYYDFYPEELIEWYKMYFEECYLNPDETKMEIYVEPLVEKDDDYAIGNASNVLTVAGIKKSMEVHTHTPSSSPKITKANATTKKPGYNKTVCKECGEEIKTNATYYYPKTVTVSTVTYNGKSQTPKVVVKDSKGKTISSSHYTVSTVKAVGTNTVTITFKSTSAYYTGKLTATCKVNPVKTAISSISTGTTKPTVKWTKKTTYVTGYQIQYATNKSFKSAKTVTVKGSKYTSKAISLSKGKTYYLRIRTYYTKSKVNYYSAWSSAKSVVIPNTTTIKSVTAGSKKLTVKWTKKTSYVTGYQIQYSTSKSFKSAKTVTIKKDTTTSTTIKKLKGKKKYYVRIRTYQTSGGKKYYSAWSSAKSKTTKK